MLKRFFSFLGNKKKCGSAKVAVNRLKETKRSDTRKGSGKTEKGTSMLRTSLLLLAFFATLVFFTIEADAQLADLDLLEDNDRSVGLSMNAQPDLSTGKYTESRSAIVLIPLGLGKGDLTFQGGAGAYWSQTLLDGQASSYLQWRVQGGPQWHWAGLQFYVEGFWKQSVNYAGFVRFGEFDLGHVLLSTGFGTLVRADTQTDLAVGIERNAAGGGDQTVKGLLLVSGEVDTPIFESLRALGTFLPGFDGENDYVVELQAEYSFRDINLVGLGRFGWEGGETTRRYTALVKVPF